MLSGKSHSITMPLKSTAGAAIRRRAAATFGANNMNVSTSAAGFNAGEASITANDGASRADRSYTAVKTDATQHEHNISGAPAAADMNCALSGLPRSGRTNQSAGTKALTAALIKMPNTSAGQI